MSRRGDAFPSRRSLVASIFILCILSLLLWHLSPSQPLLLRSGPSSSGIYDLYIEGIGRGDDTTNNKISPELGTLEPSHDQVVEGTSDGFDLPRPSADFRESAADMPLELYDPYPDYNSKDWRKKWHGAHFPCKGPRGVDVNGNPDDMLGAYKPPSTALTPVPLFGSYETTGLGSGYCFERHARNSPYGDEDRPGDGPNDRPQPSNVDWDKINWGQLQHECASLNQDRFEERRTNISPPMFRYPNHQDIKQVNSTLIVTEESRAQAKPEFLRRRGSSGARNYKKRNAILLRTYDSKDYTPDNLFHIRSMITELSLHSGAEYEVFLLVQILDVEKPIFFDPKAYQDALDLYVPREFHDIAVLFNVPMMEAWYPKAGKHDPNNSQQVHMTQPLQLFSLIRPDFDLYWQFELDVRYTGHHYHHLEAIRQWAEKQPRRLSWERAAYFYSPLTHGTWANFCRKIQSMFEGGGVWGAITTTGIEPIGSQPPTDSPEEDDFEWGVGEPADMINIMPIIDPVQDGMMFRNWINNYPDGKEKTPRRSAPITPLIATSKRLLRAMHHSQVTMGTHMMPEMFPESSALHHGLKAVAFPEPVYLDIHDKTPEELESIFNDQSPTGMWNGGSQNSQLAQHINYWWSANFKPEFSNILYRRWLGIDGHGNRAADRRLCLPAITLHPIKGI